MKKAGRWVIVFLICWLVITLAHCFICALAVVKLASCVDSALLFN